jgi:Protein of unknown function (DUF2742)
VSTLRSPEKPPGGASAAPPTRAHWDDTGPPNHGSPVKDWATQTIAASQQVSWWSVHEHVAPVLASVQSWPMVGTPAWCALPDSDPAKWAALLSAAEHWALRVETCQQALADAGSEISAHADWSSIAQRIRTVREFYAARPWIKRVVA